MRSLWIQLGQCQVVKQEKDYHGNVTPIKQEIVAALLAFAQDKAEFEAFMAQTDNVQSSHFQPTLAPLPAETFFQRHGMIELIYHAKGLGKQEVRLVEIEKLVTEKPTHQYDENYLLCHHITPVPLP
ncbi:hypothetical protein [Actinobacillus vicugnae]|uniref:hypothetical protein n=1 Tax=Actinobacillus vicugnae TaxID=2573093 RepID=UPI001FCB5482|nr:hypothetical protein [Actinobacillus vicugnae]